MGGWRAARRGRGARADAGRAQDQLKREQVEYLRKHPELQHVLNDFVSALLLQKPEDAYEFAAQHFAPFKEGGEGGEGK